MQRQSRSRTVLVNSRGRIATRAEIVGSRATSVVTVKVPIPSQWYSMAEAQKGPTISDNEVGASLKWALVPFNQWTADGVIS